MVKMLLQLRPRTLLSSSRPRSFVTSVNHDIEGCFAAKAHVVRGGEAMGAGEAGVKGHVPTDIFDCNLLNSRPLSFTLLNISWSADSRNYELP